MSAWMDARRVLCVRLDNLGDVLMSTPAIRALKEVRPDRHITLLASHSGATVARYVPEVDEVVTCEVPWMKASAPRLPCGEQALVERLRAQRFDAAVIFTTYSQSALPAALLCTMADIPLRLAYCRENPYQLLSDWQVETEPERTPRHEVRRLLDLVATIGAGTRDERLSFRVKADEHATLRVWLNAEGVSTQASMVIVHPGATAASRRYPHFAQVVATLSAAMPDSAILVTGSSGERTLCESVIPPRARNVHCIAGKLSLGEFAALISEADLLLSNNSGPVHLAAALGTPVVDLYALTNPQHTPWQVPHRVLYHDVPCANCYKSVCPQGHHACLALLDPAEVCSAVMNLLLQTRDQDAMPDAFFSPLPPAIVPATEPLHR